MDAEYYSREHLEVERRLLDCSSSPLGRFADLIASAFYPAATQLYGEDGVPFARCVDVVQHPVIAEIQDGKFERLPREFIERSGQVREVTAGDLIISKVGTPCYASLVTDYDRIALSRTVLGITDIHDIDPAYLMVFLRSHFGFSQLMRERELTIQYQLTLDRVRRVLIYEASGLLQRRIAAVVRRHLRYLSDAENSRESAVTALLDALGLGDWSPPEPLTYISTASNVLTAERLDAQFFRPMYDQLTGRLRSTGRAVRLGDRLSLNTRGRQPEYTDEGLPVVNSKHVRKNRVVMDDVRLGKALKGHPQIMRGDLLVNGTGVGTIGRAAPYLASETALPDNHVTILRAYGIDAVFLSVFLNSPLGQLQIERYIKGSSGQIELYPSEIAELLVWEAPDNVQHAVRGAIMSAVALEELSREALHNAKGAVEIAIEQSDEAALRFLDDRGA